LDFDRLKGVELLIEEENALVSRDKIAQKFTDLVLYLNKEIFAGERKRLDDLMKSGKMTPELLSEYQQLLQKGRQMKILK
jgi:hypothetical protein